MPVYSMTGYASATTGALSVKETTSHTKNSQSEDLSVATNTMITVELRSVNGRFLDLGFRVPDEMRSLEPKLRELISATVRRGKVELRLAINSASDVVFKHPSVEQLQQLAQVQAVIQNHLPSAFGLSVCEVLQWAKGSSERVPTEGLQAGVIEATRQAVLGLLDAKSQEGAKLVMVFNACLAQLQALVDQAEPLIPMVVQRQQQRFLDRWQEVCKLTDQASHLNIETMQERALNEAASYAVRIDVAEELNRLRAHLDEFSRLLKTGGVLGKRLEFLIQELLREANTLASKASCLELTNLSLEMKVLIEQLREQVQNIE
jgi:uncharacterized protein (TIGR00255 family)